jgi:TolB protein
MLMMNRRFFVVTVMLMLLPLPARAAQYDYIEISNPFLRKTPIAVPAFQVAADGSDLAETAVAAARLMAYYLEFSGYFTISDPAAFLENPATMDISGRAIRYRNWTAIGAELLVTGGVKLQNGEAEFELRLFDTIKEKLLIGKRYRGDAGDYQRVVRRFCSEILYAAVGSRGFFDSKLVFVSNGTGHKELYTCNFDGSDIRQFTRHKSISLFPAWSSDGRWIAYTTYAERYPRILIQHVSENRVARIAKPKLQMAPAWVPGKFEMAASLSFSGDQEIYLLTGNGKVVKRLTNSVGIDVEPTWSPDGKRMAFVSRRSGNPQIYIYNDDTGRVQRLTFEGRYNTQPSWSPKGDKIAYSAMRSGVIDIFTISPEGGEPVQLTENQGSNEAPTWSPDGSLIAFGSTREGPSRIYVMTAYGTDQRRLLSLPGEQTNPKWSPNILNP